ncbi:MAG: hypothetical protein QME52_08035 [Bacteroidota bacterium]|nr:hypothetical protein [Bacteroidota bacterium]
MNNKSPNTIHDSATFASKFIPPNGGTISIIKRRGARLPPQGAGFGGQAKYSKRTKRKNEDIIN